MNSSRFQDAFDAASSQCELLTREEARRFIENGYVVVKNAFDKRLAREVCEGAWEELRNDHAIEENDPTTWCKPFHGHRGMNGYVRLRGPARSIRLEKEQPIAFQGQLDVIGGRQRLPDHGAKLAWGCGAIGNLGVLNGPRWQPPSPIQPGWHKDGWHFRHFLNSPEQGLLTVPIYSDILPRSGGTFIAPDSLGPVARLLAENPQGLHPDSVQGAGYLIPGMIQQCHRFEELTGEAGDMAVIHPFMLHRVSQNPTTRPRFIANMAVVLQSPMQFHRRDGDAYSLVELAVLHALNRSEFEFNPSREPLAVRPGPFRKRKEMMEQRKLLREEMAGFARNGVVTPEWGEKVGYQSNRNFAPN